MTLKCLGRNQHDNNKLEQSLCANRAVSEHSGTCMHARTRTQTNAHTHTQMQTQTQTHTHAHPNAHNLALTCTHTYTHAHQSVHAPKLLMVRVSAVFKPSKCKHTHNLTLTRTHTHKHTCTPKCTRTQAVDGPGECCLQAVQVRAPIDGANAVGKAHKGVIEGI